MLFIETPSTAVIIIPFLRPSLKNCEPSPTDETKTPFWKENKTRRIIAIAVRIKKIVLEYFEFENVNVKGIEIINNPTSRLKDGSIFKIETIAKDNAKTKTQTL